MGLEGVPASSLQLPTGREVLPGPCNKAVLFCCPDEGVLLAWLGCKKCSSNSCWETGHRQCSLTVTAQLPMAKCVRCQHSQVP